MLSWWSLKNLHFTFSKLIKLDKADFSGHCSFKLHYCLCKTKQNKTKQDKTKQNKTGQNKTKQYKQNKTKQIKTKQNKTK